MMLLAKNDIAGFGVMRSFQDVQKSIEEEIMCKILRWEEIILFYIKEDII